MSLRGIVFLTLCWLLFLALIAVEFLSLGLIPVLAPVLVTLILGQIGLLQSAHQFAERFRPARGADAPPKALPAPANTPSLVR